jgi:hypothetical protein
MCSRGRSGIHLDRDSHSGSNATIEVATFARRCPNLVVTGCVFDHNSVAPFSGSMESCVSFCIPSDYR